MIYKRSVKQMLLVMNGYKRLLLSFSCSIIVSCSFAQQSDIEFKSSDTALQTAFYRAKEMALSYRGNPSDPVGAWYEAALPSRNAFCIRDVSHQVIAAEALGMSAENKNMLTRFVTNISKSKDWCTYWEMNKFGKPAPEDFRDDTAFWYNLNANFELIYTSWRMYLWTGDKNYITNPLFKQFFDITVNEYINHWELQADSLLKRPPHLHAPVPYNSKDYFHSCRGIPSYYESVEDMRMSSDLVAAIIRALKCYAAIAKLESNNEKAVQYEQRSATYLKQLETVWWNSEKQLYYNFYTNANTFGNAEGETFLLWYNVLKDNKRIKSTINHLITSQWNVENLSYLPHQLCRYGYRKEAYQYILHLTNPATKRREYPEVSFGVIEGIVQGIMGVEPDARFNRVTTIYNSHNNYSSEICNLTLLSKKVNIKHWPKGSSLTNKAAKQINWRAAFYGSIKSVMVNGKKVKPTLQTDEMGNKRSYIDVSVSPGKTTKVLVL